MRQPAFTIRLVSGDNDTVTQEISVYVDGQVSGITGNFQVINRLPEHEAKAFQRGIAKGREIERSIQSQRPPITDNGSPGARPNSLKTDSELVSFLRDFFKVKRQ